MSDTGASDFDRGFDAGYASGMEEAYRRAPTPEERAAVRRVAAALEALLAYDAAQTSPAGIQAARCAANRAMAALQPGDIEAAKAIGGQN